jgi:hypothetical protein
MTALEDAGQFISFARFDWLVSKSWNRLHAVLEWTDEHRADMESEWAVLHPVRLACGRVASYVCIPGMFTRMGAERCAGCCRATGMPRGTGSPKNDNACRVVLGLPADGSGTGDKAHRGR